MNETRASSNPCSRCGLRQRHPNHSWCVECRREDSRKYAAKYRADPNRKALINERRKTPAYREVQNKYQRNRYATDPEYRQMKLDASWTPERTVARRERYKNDVEYREQEKTASRNQRENLKNQVYEMLGNQCTCCGETTRAFLSVDHINNDGAEHRRKLSNNGTKSIATTSLYRDILRQGCPKDKFQILCMNCQHGKYRNGICPHQEQEH